MDRIACVHIARYELALRARAEPALWAERAAVTDLSQGAARLSALTPAAEAAGLRLGQLASHARALCPDLAIYAPDPAALRAAEEEILRALSAFSPLLDSDGRGAFFLGLGGLERLFPREEELARRARSALAGLGLPAQVAVADEALCAWIAARRAGADGLAIVPRGADEALLEEVPLALLGLSETALRLLGLLGVRTAGQIVRLPPGSLLRRLGAEGARLERLCRRQGVFAWPSDANVPESPEREVLELELPLEDLEPILFVTKSLVDRLMGRLGRARRALAELELRVRLFDRSLVVHRVTPPRPTLDGAVLLDLLRLWYASRPLGAPISALELCAARTGPAAARQVSLLDRRQEEEADALLRATARLCAAFGADAVVRPALGDSFRPERRLKWLPFAAAPRAGASAGPPPAPADSATPLALRLCAAPTPIAWEGHRLRAAGAPPVSVVATEGPHKLAGEWWDEPFDRSYYWVATSDGALLWIFRDERDGAFYLQAVAD